MIDWTSTALLFPGQGSQQVGMGADLARQYPSAAAVFEEADQILGTPFSDILFNGPAETLDDTANTQPALYIMGVAVLRTLEALHGTIQPFAAAGHSLGEFTALTAAGALPFDAGLRLVHERGRLMKLAGENNPGAMAALLGPDVPEVQTICNLAQEQTGKPVVIANDNCPGQVVISGDTAALEAALNIAKERGVKRAIKLAVSVATHSPLMAQASEALNRALADTPFNAPGFPIIGNVNAQPLHTPNDIVNELNAQLVSTVRWNDSMQTLLGLGARNFLELGSKDVLTGLLKRIDRNLPCTPLNSVETIAALGA